MQPATTVSDAPTLDVSSLAPPPLGSDAKRVYYLSLEFLMGRTLGNSLVNMGPLGETTKALHELGYKLEPA